MMKNLGLLFWGGGGGRDREEWSDCFQMPLVILQGLAWHEIGRSKDRSEEEEKKARRNNVQARTDRTVGENVQE